MPGRLRDFVHRHATRMLTAPLRNQIRCSGQDLDDLRRHVRKGDVVLVCGDQRVSEVIRYLTQSSWSHAAIYVGDELLRSSPATARRLEDAFGEDARHMLVEALVGEGVVASPLGKYRSFHLRVCRPFGVEEQDLETLVDSVLSHLGGEYDVANLLDLGRYFLPVSLVPARLRRHALEFGSGRPTEVICSSMIARGFDAIGFPILPRTEDELAEIGATGTLAARGGGRSPRRIYHAGEGAPSWPSRRPTAEHLRMRDRPFGLVTPRDFDLSPYFEIVKFSLIEGARREAEREQPAPIVSARRPGMARRAAAAFPLWRRLQDLSTRAAASATGRP